MAHVAVTVSRPGWLGLRRWAATPRTGGLLALAAVIALLPLALTNNYFYEIAFSATRIAIS